MKAKELGEKRRRGGGEGSENEEISFMGEICFFSLLYRRSKRRTVCSLMYM